MGDEITFIKNPKKTMKLYSLIAILALFLTGCSHLKHAKPTSVYLAKDINFQLLDLWKVDHDITLNQIVVGTYEGKSYSMNVITQISKKKMTVIGLTPFGVRAFTLNYDGQNLDLKLSGFIKNAEEVKPEYILADMQLIYYPLADIRKNISGNISVKETNKKGLKRIFYHGKKPFIEINYSSDDVWKSEIIYKNLGQKYQYKIRNL